ncbi:MAG: hypothetical protein ACRDOO_12205 [Actinomadura sp.]
MNPPPPGLETACRIADAVLYEGYLLYPYRASATKNRLRWQFGVLVPPGFTATGEPSANRTECLLETTTPQTVLRLRLRFLHLRSRTVERAEHGGHRAVPELVVADTTHLTFDDATEREVEAVLSLADLLDTEQTIEIDIPGDRSIEPLHDASGERRGRVINRHRPLRAALIAGAERLPGPYGPVRLHVRTANTARWTEPGASREQALQHSLISTHLLIGVTGGAFVSLLDPPEWARTAATGCRNEHAWPVLAGTPGQRDVLLSAPIILYDHPAIAPESPGHLFDSTEIDELLGLCTLSLTDEEKREAQATDPRAAEIIERVDGMPPELVGRLHGAIRQLNEATAAAGPPEGGDTMPDDSVTVAGVMVGKGSRVRLRPGQRRADAHDMFLAGRTAVVEAVLLDVDGVRHLAVTLEDDPGADLYRSHGRFRYFAPDEVEPLGDSGP